MTYRLMAEWTTDLICKKLNLSAICTTATEKLPGSRESIEEISKKIISVPTYATQFDYLQAWGYGRSFF